MEAQRIADQLRRAHEGKAWHGPSLGELLKGVGAEQAAARPVGGAHSIWELLLHIEAWERAGVRRLRGDPAKLSEAEDWPPVHDAGEEAWSAAVDKMEATSRELREAVSRLDDDALDGPVVEGMSSAYVTLHGIVQHTLYHAGQIAILKKALA